MPPHAGHRPRPRLSRIARSVEQNARQSRQRNRPSRAARALEMAGGFTRPRCGRPRCTSPPPVHRLRYSKAGVGRADRAFSGCGRRLVLAVHLELWDSRPSPPLTHTICLVAHNVNRHIVFFCPFGQCLTALATGLGTRHNTTHGEEASAENSRPERDGGRGNERPIEPIGPRR